MEIHELASSDQSELLIIIENMQKINFDFKFTLKFFKWEKIPFQIQNIVDKENTAVKPWFPKHWIAVDCNVLVVPQDEFTASVLKTNFLHITKIF